MIKSTIYIFLFVLLSHFGQAQLIVFAGSDKLICVNGSTTLGGSPTASGGTAPYKYKWSPSTFLNSDAIANPIASGVTYDVLYTLSVMDKDSNTAVAYVLIKVDQIHTFNAGIDTGYCFGQINGIRIGASNNNNTSHSFNWLPASGLDDPTATNPIASPTITTTYVLTVSDGVCPNKVSQVTVTPFLPPPVDAGIDTIIDEGNTITLTGSGGIKYWWQPDYNIRYGHTPNPDVWPITTTTYTLYVEDQHKCTANDIVTVEVIPGDLLFFYSAFTPNGDGDNDVFYIGNLEKYPDNNLKIYNRYGKMIYSATNYANDWNGTYLGDQIPTGTYFYILNDGKNKQHKGTVTIMR